MKDASLEVQWLAKMSTAAGYVVIVISASFDGQGEMRLYAFACPPKPRGRHILSLVEAYSIGGGTLQSVTETESKMEVGTYCEEV